MTEAKRVTFNTISSTVSSSLMTAGSSSSIRFGANFLAQPEKSTTASVGSKSCGKTIRLSVELFQTDSNKYPEFNYAKLLHLQKKKIKKLKQKSNGYSDPFEENDDEVARIAKELEKKYGNAYSTGRGKNKRDDVDIGLGYDESDSFIDNTEAYDELIPDEVETIEGGFYINCGALEFKKLHTESYTTKTDEIIKMPNRPKKRVISSSSEESSSGDDDEDVDDDESDEDDDDESGEGSSLETSKSKSSASMNDKKSKQSATTSNPAKKKAVAAENGGLPKKNKEKNLTSGPSCSASNSPKMLAEERASDIERNVKKIEKTTTVKDMLKAQRDNFLKSQTSSSNGESKSKSSAEDDDDSSSDDSDDDDEDDSDDNSDSNQSDAQVSKGKKLTTITEDQGNEKLRTSDTNLPELERDVLSSIIEFRDGLKSQNLIGKKFQFDDKLSEIFLKIDDSLLCLDKTQRNMVFAHLEFHLSLPKYYFLRKAKQLRIKEEKLKTKRTFNKLHKAVTETMPAVIASFEAELRKYTELQAKPNPDHTPKMPKKKFTWNANLRNLLYDVYQVRWTSYPVLGTRKETLEEFITSFMREKVVDIWPKSWMRYEELQKEIEKRKTAAKKAKEKKKAVSTGTSGQSSPNPNVPNNPLTTLQLSNVSSLVGTNINAFIPSIVANTTQPVSFIKQFEEFNNRSNANSDTDSVASSSTSSGLKRKTTEVIRNKVPKTKAAKLNGDQTKSLNNNSKNNRNPLVAAISVDLVSPNKRTDHSINHIMSPTEVNALPSMASSIFSATTAAVSQPLKHSTSTHVIDLDNYKSVGDILQTSKDIQAAANAAASSQKTNKSTVSRRESSGDSEIEIVGVFPARQQNKKLKSNNRSATPNLNHPNTEKTLQSSSHHHSYQHSNNNNRKKLSNSGLINLPGMDVNKMVKTLIELGDELQIKPILTSTAQQQTKSSSTQISQGSESHQ